MADYNSDVSIMDPNYIPSPVPSTSTNDLRKRRKDNTPDQSYPPILDGEFFTILDEVSVDGDS